MPGLLPFTEEMKAAYGRLNNEQRESLIADADSDCTNGFDNDGSSGYEIFENGFELAERAAGRPVYAHDDEEITFFLIGTPEEVIARIEEAGRS